MCADILGFDANEVEPAGDFEAIPAGRYEVMMSDSEWKDTASGNGKFLKLVFTVIAGQYKDKPLVTRLNLVNPSEKAVQIARGQLSAICRAVGVLTPRDTTQLHNLPLVVRVDVREGDGEYAGAKFNDVKAFYPKDGNGNAAQKAPEPPDKKPAAPAGAPWTKR